MNHRWAPKKQLGFTIVELIIVIVVIGILAAIVIASFSGVRARAKETAITTDLTNAAKVMEVAKSFDGAYPSSLPPSISTSSANPPTLVPSTLPYYPNVTPVQNGVLLSQICQNLISEGKGKGTNLGGSTDAYITGCGNWNANSMQVTGWDTKVFTTPIASDTFTNYATSVPSGDAWHPNQQSVIRGFYMELQSRLAAQGGAFPVASFWDSWASPGNGVMKQELPAPEPADSGRTFCIQITADGTVWSVRPNGTPVKGAC